MKSVKLRAVGIAFCLVFSIPQASGARIDTRMVDGLKIQSPTRVQAGKPFQIKVISIKNRFTGICWMDWSESKGFATPNNFKIKKGVASVKILPIEPGAARMSFYCGTDKLNPLGGGSTQIYIAP